MGADEISRFESSEMLASFLASTSLLSESWSLCDRANSAAPQGFVTNQIEEVTYVAFSGVQALCGIKHGCCRSLVGLDAAGNGLFPAMRRQDGGADEEVMVDASFLHLFLCFYNCPNFQNQMLEIMQKSKSLVFTGHSLGGTVASLSTLWILSYLRSLSSPLSVLCITFGSPLLGNAALSQAILQERWGGNFWHVVAKTDIVPRLLLAPVEPLNQHLHYFLQFWQLSMRHGHFTVPLTEEVQTELFSYVLVHVEELLKAAPIRSLFWPFGSYMFCTKEGAVCLDNATAVVKLLHLMLAAGSPNSSIMDHLQYENYVNQASYQFLNRRGFMDDEILLESSYEVGISLALHSSDMANQQVRISGDAKECLRMAKPIGHTPNRNSADLAIGLSKVTPLRAQIEWYQTTCDESDNQLGYYDEFKQRGASRRRFKVYMNCKKLARFWNEVIRMLDNNQLPHDFHKREKWVNAAQFYKLLVEPLDIAEYYQQGMHRTKGHYLKHGRERRYEIFDRWWRDRKVGEEENKTRSKLASLTQDSCFWARVEEAREWLDDLRSDSHSRNRSLLWENIVKFEQYAEGMVERKEVSRDVMAKNSSYSLWVEEWQELKSHFPQFQLQFHGFVNGEVVPP